MAIFHVWNLVHPNITGLATLLLSMASTKESNFRREILQSNKQKPHNVRFWQISSFLMENEKRLIMNHGISLGLLCKKENFERNLVQKFS